MFGFSLAYNMTPPSPLKMVACGGLIHSSIYLMIAGTYYAAALSTLEPDVGLGSRDRSLRSSNSGGRS